MGAWHVPYRCSRSALYQDKKFTNQMLLLVSFLISNVDSFSPFYFSLNVSHHRTCMQFLPSYFFFNLCPTLQILLMPQLNESSFQNEIWINKGYQDICSTLLILLHILDIKLLVFGTKGRVARCIYKELLSSVRSSN